MNLPRILPWTELQPGDLAWDPGDSDLVTGHFAPLLHVGDVGRWLSRNGVELDLNPIDWSDPLGRGGAACPWAVLLASGIPRDPDRIVAAVAAVAEAARELVRQADTDETAQALERAAWPFTAELLAPIDAEQVMKCYRWRIDGKDAADQPRVVAEHKRLDAPIDAWAAVRNPDTLAKLRNLTPEGALS
jgi:hypothetical protein